MMNNIKIELENNTMLKKELGPFESQETEWGAYSIVIPKYGAKIMVLSMEQPMRGIRYGSNRPDLILLDDVEDLSTIKNPEIRDKTWDMITGSILPAGAENLKIIVIGSKLHEDGIVMRFRKEIDTGARKNSNYMEVPIVYNDGTIAWPERFKTMKEIEIEKMVKTGGNETAWRREYLNEIVAEDDAIIFEKDIQRYSELLPFDDKNEYRFVVMAIDPAVSLKKTADYTAITIMVVYGYDEHLKIRIYPLTICERMEGPDIVDKIKETYKYFYDRFGAKPKIFVETVGAFLYITQTLKKEHIASESVTVREDKRTRLESIQGYIKDGTVLFPEKKLPDLEKQLVAFGTTKHDDLCDSFTMGIRVIADMDHKKRSFGGAVILEDGTVITTSTLDLYEKDPIEFKKQQYREMQKLCDEGYLDQRIDPWNREEYYPPKPKKDDDSDDQIEYKKL